MFALLQRFTCEEGLEEDDVEAESREGFVWELLVQPQLCDKPHEHPVSMAMQHLPQLWGGLSLLSMFCAVKKSEAQMKTVFENSQLFQLGVASSLTGS